MSGPWAFNSNDGTFAVVGGTQSMRLNRCLTDSARTRLGGGMVRFTGDDRFGPWTLTYDEVFYVTAGTLCIQSDANALELHAGDIGLIGAGTTVTYVGTEGTEAFYVVTPRDWEREAGNLDLTG